MKYSYENGMNAFLVLLLMDAASRKEFAMNKSLYRPFLSFFPPNFSKVEIFAFDSSSVS